MVRKNMDHPLREIGRWKSRKNRSGSTWKYQIVGGSTRFDGAGTKICGTISFFLFSFFRIRAIRSFQCGH
jgi:hypothetical protein